MNERKCNSYPCLINTEPRINAKSKYVLSKRREREIRYIKQTVQNNEQEWNEYKKISQLRVVVLKIWRPVTDIFLCTKLSNDYFLKEGDNQSALSKRKMNG